MRVGVNMDILRVSILGLIGMFLAIFFKNGKQEYGTYICLITGVIIFAYVVSAITEVKQVITGINSYLTVGNIYMETLFKMVGVTYLSEFSSNICKDAGFGAIAGQIEVFGKLSVLILSLPVILSLLDTLNGFLG